VLDERDSDERREEQALREEVAKTEDHHNIENEECNGKRRHSEEQRISKPSQECCEYRFEDGDLEL
jgi:hypothetical protein